MISGAPSAGEASMNLIGCINRRRASSRRPSLARSAVSPTSPVIIPASCTAAWGFSKASATAASSKPSRRPMRNSPVRTLTTYLAVRQSHRRSSAPKSAPLAAVPEAASIAA